MTVLKLASVTTPDIESENAFKKLQVLSGIYNYFKFVYGECVREDVYVNLSRVCNILAGILLSDTGLNNSTITVLNVSSRESDCNPFEILTKCRNLGRTYK